MYWYIYIIVRTKMSKLLFCKCYNARMASIVLSIRRSSLCVHGLWDGVCHHLPLVSIQMDAWHTPGTKQPAKQRSNNELLQLPRCSLRSAYDTIEKNVPFLERYNWLIWLLYIFYFTVFKQNKQYYYYTNLYEK